jgi:hypothetical protein
MALLQFMPWCPIDKIYHAGEISIIPFNRDQKTDDFDELEICHIRTILSSYRNLEGHPVEEVALVKYKDKPILADLNDDEIEIARECADLICFSGLANREYFNQLGAYCNADCFLLYGQRFKEDPSFIGVTSRRREGRNLDGRPLAETIFSIPVHTNYVREVRLDENILSALINYRDSSLDDNWLRWQNAISCFNQANTDNDTVHYQVEWVLLCSAFEHLLAAKSEAKDVAQKFADVFMPNFPLPISKTKRKSNKWQNLNSHLRYEWIKEFYRIRGDFSHGKLKTRQPTTWKPLEHIVLATIAFHLLVRVLLSKKGHYILIDDDQAQIDAFEKIADEDFLNPPTDQKSSMDSWYSQFIRKARYNLTTRRAIQNLELKGLESEDENLE